MPMPPLKNPPQLTRRISGFLSGLAAVGWLFILLLGINIAQTLSLIIRPFSQSAFRSFNRGCAGLWWSQCVWWARTLYGSGIQTTGDPLPMEENAIIVCNHQQMSDITYLMYLSQAHGRLADMKWYVKDILKWIPGIGWGMLFLDCIFLKRNWLSDQESIAATFRRLTENQVPTWLISFVEGTRITPDKAERSRTFAAANGLQPLKHVLTPRTKGFVATVQALRGYIPAVYDVTIGYPEGVPSLWQYSQGFSRIAHIHVQRFAIEDLPGTDEELKAWLLQRFSAKDQLLDSYYRTGLLTSAPPQSAPPAEPA